MARKRTASPPARGTTSRKATTLSAASSPATPAEATLFQGPQHWVAAWSQFADQLQRAGEQTLQGLRHDAEAAESTGAAEGDAALAGAPIGLVEQATRWAQLSTQVTASLLDVQAAWFKDFEALTSQWMSPWLTDKGRIAFTSAQDLVEPPEPNGPMQALWSAQRLWSESAKVWLHAMSHDLQDEPSLARR